VQSDTIDSNRRNLPKHIRGAIAHLTSSSESGCSPCAKPWALVRGSPGAKLTLDVSFYRGRKYLPVIKLRRAARAAQRTGSIDRRAAVARERHVNDLHQCKFSKNKLALGRTYRNTLGKRLFQRHFYRYSAGNRYPSCRL